MKSASEMLRDPDFDYRSDFYASGWEALIQVVEAAERLQWVWSEAYENWECPDCRAPANAEDEHKEGCEIAEVLTALRDALDGSCDTNPITDWGFGK